MRKDKSTAQSAFRCVHPGAVLHTAREELYQLRFFFFSGIHFIEGHVECNTTVLRLKSPGEQTVKLLQLKQT